MKIKNQVLLVGAWFFLFLVGILILNGTTLRVVGLTAKNRSESRTARSSFFNRRSTYFKTSNT